MKILYLDTSKEDTEIGIYEDNKVLSFTSYHAHRVLSQTILRKIEEALKENSMELKDIEGILCYIGPGSFTGLRIGISLVNALADSLGIPIYGIRLDEEIDYGINQLIKSASKEQLEPFYGAAPHITEAKK